MGFALRRDQGFPIALDLRIKYFSIRIMLSLIKKEKKESMKKYTYLVFYAVFPR